MARYGLYGAVSRDFLTYMGRILVHDNQHELAFLIPGGATVRELPRDIPDGQTMPIRSHPELAAIQWPLTKGQF
jgi:hypothetical protein